MFVLIHCMDDESDTVVLFIGLTDKQVVGSPGNNLHEAVTSKGERFLVSMPTKFRKNIWIKRGKGFDIINAFSFENQHGADHCLLLFTVLIAY